MIDVRDAFRIARDQFDILISDAKESASPRLEEVELTEDERFWLITLGYEVASSEGNPPEESGRPVLDFRVRPKMRYKVFKIDAESGRVWSMKIRAWSES